MRNIHQILIRNYPFNIDHNTTGGLDNLNGVTKKFLVFSMNAGWSDLVINLLVYSVKMDPQLQVHQTKQTDQPQFIFDI